MNKFNLNTKSLLAGIAAGIASAFFAQGAFAQVQVTSVVNGSAGPTHASLAAAVTWVNNGANSITGGVTFTVANGSESAPSGGYVITRSGTSSDFIKFEKASGATVLITASAGIAAADAVITLNGADYVTIDGIDIQELAGNNTGSTSTRANRKMEYGYLIKSGTGGTNGASNNTIKNSIITLFNATTNTNGSTGILQTTNNTFGGGVAATDVTGANSNNTYQNITIQTASAGIYCLGTSATYPDLATTVQNITVGNATANNIIHTAATYGIKLSFQSGVTVSANTIRNVTSSGANAVDGIVFMNTAGTNNVYNNKIETVTSSSTGGTVKGINVTNTDAASIVNIYNNTITGLNSSNNTAATRGVVGIYLTGSVAGTHNVDFNSVRISPTTVTASNACFEIANVTPVNVIRSNVFANFTAAQTGAAKHYAFVTASATSIGGTNSVSNNNDLYISNSTNGYIGFASTDKTNLTAWQGVVAGLDANSVSVDPFFTSATDLQTANCVLKERAATGTGIITDAYSNTRSASPSIGAYDMPSMIRTGVWVGTTSTAWLTTTNWCDDAVPTTLVDVTIDNKYPNPPVVSSGTAEAKNITIGTSASLTVSGGTLTANNITIGTTATLTVSGGNFNYAGTVTNNGTFTMTSGSLTLSGSNQVVPVSTVTDLTITSPTISITSDLTVNGTLTLSSGGILTTGSNKVILGSSGSISENATSYVLGIVETQRTVTNSTETFGGLGLSVTAGGSQPGVTTVTRTNGDAGIGTYGSNSGIKRKYDISAANNTGLNATVVFSYLDAELNGLTESTLLLYRSTNGGVNWVEVSSSLDETANTLTATGVDGFSVWTMGSSVTPLPVNLVSFNAVRKNASTVSLSWKTSSELNNDRFEVERSQDGINFMNVGEVKGNGTANHIISYGFEDNAMSVNAPVLYYRLKQVDYNGAFEYSPIVRLANTTAVADIKAWYNQSEGKINLSTINTVSEIVNIKVINIQGRVVAERSAQLTKGSNSIQLDVQNLPNGIYTSIISSENGTYTSKILKN